MGGGWCGGGGGAERRLEVGQSDGAGGRRKADFDDFSSSNRLVGLFGCSWVIWVSESC